MILYRQNNLLKGQISMFIKESGDAINFVFIQEGGDA